LIASGVPGLDEVLGGGLRAGHIYFVEGAPGTGKTTLALQFALEGVRRGEATLVISMAECADELCTSAASHGWDLSGLALRDLAAPDAVRSTALFELSEVELDERVDAVLAEMDALRPARLVGALRDFCTQPWQFRRRLEQFRDKAQALGTTMLFTDDLTGGEAHRRLRSAAAPALAAQAARAAVQRRLP